ncbi:MAG: M48 family metallopeptidase [Gemmatimonadota bacterium]
MKRNAPLDAQQLALAFDAPAAPALHPDAPRSAGRSDARRCIALDHELIDYRLRRARRRSIGFQIDDGGLTVSAPRWVRLAEIEAAILEKQRWIRTKIAEWHVWRRERRLHEARFADGGVLPFLGSHVTLRLHAQAIATRLHDLPRARELHVALPACADEQQVRDAVHAWLQAEARRVLGERIERLAAPLATRLRGWTLSSARSQWGSCTHDGRIRLNWRLIHFSLPVIDYVIAHELAHLAEMNHGARFWRVVGELLPGFEPARDEIRGVDLAALSF